MKSPFATQPKHQLLHPKPLSGDTAAQNTAFNLPASTTDSCYEPTSVLDPRWSSSPAAAVSETVPAIQTVSGVMWDDPLQWEDTVLHQAPLSSSEDWDSTGWDLGEKEDSVTTCKSTLPQFGTYEPQNLNLPNLSVPDPCFNGSSPVHPDFNPSIFTSNQNPSPNYNSSNLSDDFYQLQSSVEPNLQLDYLHIEQLIRAAACFESNQLPLAQAILARLNQRLQSPVGKPLLRTAFYFKEALQALLTDSNRTGCLSSLEIVHKIRAYKALCEISPITLFSNFTANQALLEALDGKMFLHVIDFDIGFGGQWASFLQELANRSEARKVPPSALRITAVIPEESSVEAKLIKDILYQFAGSLGIRFHIDFLSVRTFGIVMFNAIRFINGETIAVSFSPAILRHLNISDSVAGFLFLLRRISPQIIVFVDDEGWRNGLSASFPENFINGLELYSSVLESLDAASTGRADLMGRIERYLLRPKIFAAVAAARNRILPWRELFSGAGMVSVPFSEFNHTQAECLVPGAQVRGFRVAKREASMLLCWQEREVVATSAWRFPSRRAKRIR